MKEQDERDPIRNVFKSFSATKTSEREILNKLSELKPKEPELISFELLSELMAFEFDEKKENEISEWGTHFAPMIVITYTNGSKFESPSITKVSKQTIDYWVRRSEEESNPVVKARYLGLVYDFKEKFEGFKPPIDLVLKYIDSLIQVAEDRAHSDPYQTFERIRWAMFLSILYNQNQFISRIKNAVIAYEREQPDNSPGYWGHSFEILIDNKKVNLSLEDENNIIDNLELRLKRLTGQTTAEIKPWVAEEAAKYLAGYYKKKDKINDVRRVLQLVERAYNLIIENAPSMQASGWLQELHSLYLYYGQQDLSNNILIRLRTLGPKVNESMLAVTVKQNFRKEKIDEYLSKIFIGSLEEILIRIANVHLPRKNIAKEELLKVSKENHIRFLVRTAVQDEKGRVVASIGPLEVDLEGQLVRHIADNMSMNTPLLNLCLKELKNRFELNEETLFEFINGAQVIETSHKNIVVQGLKAYLNGEYLVAIHLLIPQFEEALRNMYEYLGGAVLKPYKEGKFELKLVEEVLREPSFIEVLTEDLSTYLRILLTDPRGWNMRNSVCHGLYPMGAFNFQSADRLIHAFFCLGLFQRSQDNNVE